MLFPLMAEEMLLMAAVAAGGLVIAVVATAIRTLYSASRELRRSLVAAAAAATATAAVPPCSHGVNCPRCNEVIKGENMQRCPRCILAVDQERLACRICDREAWMSSRLGIITSNSNQ